MFVEFFSFCTPYLWEIFATDVPVVFEFFKKREKKRKKKEEGKSFFLSYEEYDARFYSFSLLLLACSRI